MSMTYKILGQQYVGLTSTTTPGGTTIVPGDYYYGSGGGSIIVNDPTITESLEPVTLYTVPAGKYTIVSSVFATNHDVVERTYDLAIVPSGETLAAKHHIRWDYPVSANDFDVISMKLTLAAGDKIIVLPSTADKIGFTAFGVEVNI